MIDFVKANGVFVYITVLFFLIITCFNTIDAQSIDNTIDLNLIHKRKVRQFIVDQHIDSLYSYSQIVPSWYHESDIESYNKHEKTFVVKEDLSNVWECYIKTNPVQSWDGRIIDFGLLISKNTNSFLYDSKGSFSEVETGQVYFLNLKLLRGICNIPVAFEVINIDPVDKLMEFSYIEGNVTQGKQTLQFIEDDNNTTHIIHRSYFKSGSNFRDGIYPYYHKKIIKDFHRNMRHILKASLN